MADFEDFTDSLGFVVLSPEPNIARLRDTMRSIRMSFGEERPVVCCVGGDSKKAQLDEAKEICPAFKGGKTITSLINEGFACIKSEGWRLFVMEGARVPRGMDRRYRNWVRSDRDVLFPIVSSQDLEGRMTKVMANFEECTLNGMLIHSRLFQEVGKFSDNPIPVSKGFWAVGALERGAVFKAILGVKVI